MVYVDNLTCCKKPRPGMWCHLWADSPKELYAFADALGLNPGWVQDKGLVIHFDLTPAKRNAAMSQGAIAGDLRSWIRQRLRTREGIKPPRTPAPGPGKPIPYGG